MNDFVGQTESLEEAISLADKASESNSFVHVYSVAEQKIIWANGKQVEESVENFAQW